jgi:hypothetical protein
MLMTKAEAYLYVFGILEERFLLTHDDELAVLCGELAPAGREEQDRLSTSDPAAWDDWESAVNKITTLRMIDDIQSKKAMIELMKHYTTEGFHLQETIEHFERYLLPPYGQ